MLGRGGDTRVLCNVFKRAKNHTSSKGLLSPPQEAAFTARNGAMWLTILVQWTTFLVLVMMTAMLTLAVIAPLTADQCRDHDITADQCRDHDNYCGPV